MINIINRYLSVPVGIIIASAVSLSTLCYIIEDTHKIKIKSVSNDFEKQLKEVEDRNKDLQKQLDEIKTKIQ